MVSNYTTRPYWVSGNWVQPEFLIIPVTIYIDNIIRLVTEQSATVFSFYNTLLNLDENSEEYLRPYEYITEATEEIIENFPALIIDVDNETEEENLEEKRIYSFEMATTINASTPKLNKRLAYHYNDALQLLLKAAPCAEFTLGWPPSPYIKGHNLTPTFFIKTFSSGVASTPELQAQVGSQRVLKMSIEIEHPSFDNFRVS